MILRRLKNIWKLGEYRLDNGTTGVTYDGMETRTTLKKDFPTIKHKLATIVGVEKPDLFAEDDNSR